jgi:sec-independent protein translocase protein TatC
MFFSTRQQDYPDDIFAETRMSFGDHIEELRKHLLRALYGLGICLVIGFVLDGVGDFLGYPNFGVGKPMLNVIKNPVETQVRDFYAKRNERAKDKLAAALGRPGLSADQLQKLKEKAAEDGFHSLTREERESLLSTPVEMPIILPVEPLKPVFGEPKDPNLKEVTILARVYPGYLNYLSNQGEVLLENKQYLTTLSAQEGMVVYFKVSLLCGVVIASPWIFFQIWAFISAGLYPHERAYVYRFLTPSIGLFLIGVLMCQFLVLPGAVRALLAFNLWIDMDPEIRLNEWLSFAILLPLVFGVAFQTPLVMFILNRLGMFGWEDYWSRWRYAVIILALLSALLTPTPDAVTMLYLFVPMFGLYMLGVAICKFFPPQHELEDAAAEEQVAV